jgi:hypothetical protein
MANERLVTVIVPQGRGMTLMQALHDRQLLRAALSSARAPFTYVKRSGGFPRMVRHSVEKDVLNVVVPAELAEEVFAFLHERAGMGESPGGFMFMGLLSQASAFSLPPDLIPA